MPAERARRAFLKQFGAEPDLLVRAPGRVNLIGEFTDFNDGYCLPCAIDRETVVAIKSRPDDNVHVVAADAGDTQDRFELSPAIRPVVDLKWANYVRGVFAALHKAGLNLGGVEMAIAGNVPQGAGLSSSASLEIAVGEALRRLLNLPINGVDLARAGQWAEHEFAGCRCGIMDQLTSALAQRDHAVLLDCASLQTLPVAIPPAVSVLVIDSGIQRGLVESEYNQRRRQCEEAATYFGVPSLRSVSIQRWHDESSGMDPVLARRSRHVVSENQRTLEAASSLAGGDLRRMSQLMAQSHASLRDDFEVSLPAIDGLVDLIAHVIGDRGGVRMTGGGFGGCVVAVVPLDLVNSVEQAVARHYRSPSGGFGTVHICRASDGAGVMS